MVKCEGDIVSYLDQINRCVEAPCNVIPYALKFSQDETFAVFADWKPCVNILSLQKFWSSSCAMTKMAVKRTGVVEKHCSAFALFSENFHLQTNKV